MITGKTQLLGVIGYPISHSLSPVMHNAAINHLNADYVYVPFSIHPEDLSTAIAGLAAISVKGLSVTIPHKITIMPLLSHISDRARLVGAVNTVWPGEDGWHGTNTDVDGFLAPLLAMNRDWSEVNPIILGNGGAARAVIVGCAELGCKEIKVIGRDREKLNSLRESWANTHLYNLISGHTWEELPDSIGETGLLINTTPIGMSPRIEESPVTGEILGLLPAGAIVYDLIYTPRPTKFLQLARSEGKIVIDGLEMLVQQGAVALQQWLKESAPVDVMRQSLEDYLIS
ncbi:MAG: Shikimate dehydrogenase (NADP(+)) [Chroococcopsis gigantea SAG 12.99]|jgi:shikimate dehydrogenase|nr:Shikimate dehydrogenase (NADP(+)) [Chroococcopsis gigantea SAG 12.99]